MTKLSVFVTTYNNARTLDACLGSVSWADEILVLDSFSSDRTLELAERHGARIEQHAFLGFGAQKQLALEHTSHRWVLLLDADEALSPALQTEIRDLMRQGPQADGYEMPRQEQVFWRMSHPGVRWNYYLRLFDKDKGRMSSEPVHAAPKVSGRTARLVHPFYHFGETDIHVKVEKVNAYSTGLVQDKVARGRRPSRLILLFYPPWFFVRSFFFKRGFLNGWAGFIASAVSAFYVFLKYAKLFEYYQVQRYGQSLMPPGAPPPASRERLVEGHREVTRD